jgi:hypothetical protein
MHKDKENEFFIGFINFEKEIIRTKTPFQNEWFRACDEIFDFFKINKKNI